VGKEVIARELHRRSSRRDRPFVKVNCAALPADLLENEMFGHERGAFTGAESATAGKFEAAAHGTIMLDEIGEMPAALQAKLLHVLENGRFCKLGSNRELDLDVRVIAATNRPLAPMIASGHFREDLYYRLQVIEIHVPPLRERREEILPLANAFLLEFAQRDGGKAPMMSPALQEQLLNYDWPGNVRELENVAQRFVILRDESLVLKELNQRKSQREAAAIDPTPTPPAMPIPAAAMPVAAGRPGNGHDNGHGNGHAIIDGSESLPDLVRRTTDRVEREMIAHALDVVRWNRRRAAQMLGVSYKTLLNKMKALGLDAEAPPSSLVDLHT
jgi:DNA-binding NtrC family response regulator